MIEIRTTLKCKDRNQYPWPFVYRRVLSPPAQVMYNRYEGKSLEEIEKLYGKEARQEVYTHAALGFGDLTKPDASLPPDNSEEVFDLMLRQRDAQHEYMGWRRTGVQVWLMANEYTHSRRDRMVGAFEFNQLMGCYEGKWPPEMLYKIEEIVRAI